ncbi:MAG: hypothetical protein ACRDQB_09235, partial [Thermocrispum sp.]
RRRGRRDGRAAAWSGTLTPLVLEVAAAGDAVAAAIVQDAVRRLVRTVSALDPRPHEPLVLAGGLLGPDGPLTEALLAELRSRGLPEVTTVDPELGGAHGAAKLARMGLAENKY